MPQSIPAVCLIGVSIIRDLNKANTPLFSKEE
jgi:hypothetical protein